MKEKKEGTSTATTVKAPEITDTQVAVNYTSKVPHSLKGVNEKLEGLIDAVTKYQELGVHVFPVSIKKIPLVKKWNQVNFCPEDFKKQGTAGIGSCPGQWTDSLMVFDVDGPEGRKSWEECLNEYGPLPPTCGVSTGRESGGEHYWYKTPPDLYVKSLASVFAPNVDIKGTKGQAILPPSSHESGKKYSWLYNGEAVDWVDPDQISVLPAPWIKALIDKKCANCPGEEAEKKVEIIRGPTTPYGSAALEEEAKKVVNAQEGKRNETLNQAAFSIFQLVAGGEIDENEARQSLKQAAYHCGLDDPEIEKTVESAFSAGFKNPRSQPTTAPPADCGGIEELDHGNLGAREPSAEPEPIPLPEGLPPVASFDFQLLPRSLRPWAEDITERMQCPPDYVGVTLTAALGAVIGRKVGIRPQERTDWTVTANLWAFLIGRPGVMKSPAMEATLAPLKQLAAQAMEKYQEETKNYEVIKLATKLRAEAAERSAKEILKKNPKADISELLAIENEEPPVLQRYLANDTTAAALGELHRQNPNGLLVHRDEMVSLLKMLDQQENSEARGFYLTGWNGDSPYTFDRIARGMNLHIPAVCLSLLGSTQPARIAQYVKGALSGDGDDGLLQRFGLLVWPDTGSTWRDVDRFPDGEAKKAAFQVFSRLNQLDPIALGAQQDKGYEGEPEGMPYLRFNPDGLGLFREWREILEKRLRSGDLHPAVESHFAKYKKLVPGLALIIHLANGDSGPVGNQAVEKALGWSEYLETHALRLYASIISPEVTTAKAILAKIRTDALSAVFSGWEVRRPSWSGLTDRKVVYEGLTLLKDLRWITELKRDTSGRQATEYKVNPKVLQKASLPLNAVFAVPPGKHIHKKTESQVYPPKSAKDPIMDKGNNDGGYKDLLLENVERPAWMGEYDPNWADEFLGGIKGYCNSGATN